MVFLAPSFPLKHPIKRVTGSLPSWPKQNQMPLVLLVGQVTWAGWNAPRSETHLFIED